MPRRLGRRALLAALALAAWLPAGACRAQAFGNPMPAVRANNWAAAEAAVQDYPDPAARLLITYFRLLAPGGGRPDEIAAFAAGHPDWPNQDLLERRREEALAAAPSGAGLLTQCRAASLSLSSALLRCAEAWEQAGDKLAAAASARRAWASAALTEPAAEAAFMQRWGATMTPDDQAARFQALAWAASPAAARQIGRLAPDRRLAAETRLAVQHNAPTAAVLLAALAPAPSDAGLLLDRARALRRAGRTAEALALWTAPSAAGGGGVAGGTAAGGDEVVGGPAARAEAMAAGHGGEFWAERNQLARALLRVSDPVGAYAVVAGHGPLTGEPAADAAFLAGFIALHLNDPARAAMHFARLASLTGAAITQGRAGYWLGRAAAAAGRDPRPDYRAAAAWPCTFYGQLAAQALGEDPAERIRAVRDPVWSTDDALALEASELNRAAILLVAWGEPRRAQAFLLRLDELAVGAPTRAAIAHLALALGEPAVAVAIARRIGRDGGMLPEAGWPVAVTVPAAGLIEPVDPAVILGLIRQESSFDPGALSPAGARGLMQLMPATAQATAHRLGEPGSPASGDPATNMRLGTAYLRQLLDQFGGTLPLAIAAYNAGPGRVQEWLAANGDPRTAGPLPEGTAVAGALPAKPAGGPETAAPGGRLDMIDWLELIPFNETRNYVQRVLENAAIYRARRSEAAVALPVGQSA